MTYASRPRRVRPNLRSTAPATALAALVLAVGCASGTSQGEDVASTANAVVSTAQIASIALANVGKGACSTNSAGGRAFASSCTGNGGSPEYWCADFALWVWGQAGADTSGLTAAAGSFYTYGLDHGTLHSTPTVGDAVVFDYAGGGVADHVAIVTQVNANGTIESVSGDWGGTSGSEAEFSSTSRAVLNAPAYASAEGGRPGIIGMTISGYVSPAGGGSGSSGAPGGTPTAPPAAQGCYSDTLMKEMPANACVQSASDGSWYQCDDGAWTDRWTDPTACDGTYPLGSSDNSGSAASQASSAGAPAGGGGNGAGASGGGGSNGNVGSGPGAGGGGGASSGGRSSGGEATGGETTAAATATTTTATTTQAATTTASTTSPTAATTATETTTTTDTTTTTETTTATTVAVSETTTTSTTFTATSTATGV